MLSNSEILEMAESQLEMRPEITAFFDDQSNTISYIVKDPTSNACAIVDAVMEFDYAAGRLTYDGADAMIAHIQEKDLELQWIIESHVHADHLSGAPYILSLIHI